jgi:glycosyltransferase involved in cell wall biosynthesis
MACGTPVVGVKEAGIRETICDGEGGYLVDRNPEAFASKLAPLLTNDELHSEQAQRGREYVMREWSWNASIRQIEQHLYDVVETAASRL